MRSHLFPLPLPPKPQLSNDLTESILKDEKAEGKDSLYGLRENPKKSYKLVDPQFLELGSGLLRNSDSETESENPTRRRLTRVVEVEGEYSDVKLKKKLSSTESVNELEVVSSGYNNDDFEDEDVASCLMMLSRDKWRPSQTRKRYKCETCNKEFGSYQALGGHGRSHKIVKNRLEQQQDHEESMEEKPRKNVGKKLHECPVCFRVFGSGQALGGHKRSHSLGSSSTTVSTSSSTSPKQLHEDHGNNFKTEKKDETIGLSFIDLNLPVPVEYED